MHGRDKMGTARATPLPYPVFFFFFSQYALTCTDVGRTGPYRAKPLKHSDLGNIDAESVDSGRNSKKKKKGAKRTV